MKAAAIFESFPTIESEKVRLTRIEEGHLEDVFNIYSNDRVFQYCGILPRHNKETVRKMIGHFERDYAKRTRVKWGIFAKEHPDQLLGIMEAFEFQAKINSVIIGYFLAEAHWGKGWATEAVGLLRDFLFTQVGVNRIQAEVMPANEASKAVLLKNGFAKEGLLRQAALWTGKGIIDLEVYGMLREDM